MILLIIALYFSILVGIGLTGRKFLHRTGEDYFLANRSIGPVCPSDDPVRDANDCFRSARRFRRGLPAGYRESLL